MRDFSIVVAADEARGIGIDGKLPWRLTRELRYFKRVTSEAAPGLTNAVVMGRKTFLSIAPKYRPLAGRINVVLSRDPSYVPDGAMAASSLDEALEQLEASADLDQVFVIGGGQLYELALAHPRCVRVYLTRVHARFDCDAHLPAFEERFHMIGQDGPHEEGDLTYTFEVYERALSDRESVNKGD